MYDTYNIYNEQTRREQNTELFAIYGIMTSGYKQCTVNLAPACRAQPEVKQYGCLGTITTMWYVYNDRYKVMKET